MTSAPRSARIRPANAPRRSVSSTTRTWASGPATPIGALLPPHRLVAPIDEALVDVVLVRLARLRRRRPAPEERPQQAADHAAHRARRGAGPAIPPAPTAAGARCARRARPPGPSLGGLTGPALVRRCSGGLGHRLTLRDVALRALAADLLVLRVGIEDGFRRGAADQAGTEEHEELTCH